MKILVLIPVNDLEKAKIQSAMPSAQIIYTSGEAVRDNDIRDAEIIIGNIDRDKLKLCKSLKWLQLNSAGTEGYTHLINEGILLTNASGAYGLAISEHLLGMLLEIKKKLYLYRDNQNMGIWRSEGSVTSIEGAVTLVVGMGDIGGDFARKIKALGGYVIGVKRTPAQKPHYCDELYTTEDLDRLLPRADIISLSLPGNAQTDHILDRRRLELTKAGSVILNVGRGNAIDTEALCDLLEAGHFEGAGLDVTDPEPLPPNHRLWKIPNAVITPHISGFFHLRKTLERIIDISVDNLKRYGEGRELKNRVDIKTGYRKHN